MSTEHYEVKIILAVYSKEEHLKIFLPIPFSCDILSDVDKILLTFSKHFLKKNYLKRKRIWRKLLLLEQRKNITRFPIWRIYICHYSKDTWSIEQGIAGGLSIKSFIILSCSRVFSLHRTSCAFSFALELLRPCVIAVDTTKVMRVISVQTKLLSSSVKGKHNGKHEI